jgi:hypothetical protein
MKIKAKVILVCESGEWACVRVKGQLIDIPFCKEIGDAKQVEITIKKKKP